MISTILFAVDLEFKDLWFVKMWICENVVAGSRGIGEVLMAREGELGE